MAGMPQGPVAPQVPPVEQNAPPTWEDMLGEGLANLGQNWQTAPPIQQGPAPFAGRNRQMQMLLQG